MKPELKFINMTRRQLLYLVEEKQRDIITLSIFCWQYKITKEFLRNKLRSEDVNRLKYWIEANIFSIGDRKNCKDLLERLDHDFDDLTMFKDNKVELVFHDARDVPHIARALKKLEQDENEV